MEIKYINNINTEISGTSGKGSFICEYKTLVKVLGQPEEGDEYKTQAEWDIEYKDGTVTTSYDWKQGKCYSQLSTKYLGFLDDYEIENFEHNKFNII